MKLSKLSNKVRWILVLPVMGVIFFCTADFFGGLLQWNDKSVFVMMGLFVFLTGIMVAPLYGKRFITVVASLFIVSCLIPPWQFTADRNGSEGYHSRNPAGYALLIDPPRNPNRNYGSGVRIDFGPLFLEWAMLATVAGMFWLLVLKPKPPRDDNANR